ncbi:MAG TPA: hypothetical protein VND19_06455 [Acetobacteraceae bacterium]|nr:hypothetical protein [Acetobacteraceae bacterium]
MQNDVGFIDRFAVHWTANLGAFAFDLNDNAVLIPAGAAGPTAQRPSGAATGAQFFDTTLGVPIWAASTSATDWTNAAGGAGLTAAPREPRNP